MHQQLKHLSTKALVSRGIQPADHLIYQMRAVGIDADLAGYDPATKKMVFSYIAGCPAEAADIRRELLQSESVRYVLKTPRLNSQMSFQILYWTKDMESGQNECRGELLDLADLERVGP